MGAVSRGASASNVDTDTDTDTDTDEGAAAPASGRRRGAELEAAILEAAWDELVESGLARLTMRAVAARARTSEPVLYRRWNDKNQLVLAALIHHRDQRPVDAPDTGDLRTDLVEYLTAVGTVRSAFFAVAAAAAFSGLLDATGMTPELFRERIIGTHLNAQAREIFDRAEARGELDAAAVPQSVLAVPFDLVRLELLMSLRPVPAERIAQIVDEIFLPLVARELSRAPAPAPPPPAARTPRASRRSR